MKNKFIPITEKVQETYTPLTMNMSKKETILQFIKVFSAFAMLILQFAMVIELYLLIIKK